MTKEQTPTTPKLTKIQAEAIAALRRLPHGHSQSWGSGMGRYNVALRGLLFRRPDFIACDRSNGTERWSLK